MTSYDTTTTNRRTGATSDTRRVYSRAVAAAIRTARRRSDHVAWDYSNGRVLTITDRDLKWEARYVEVTRGAARQQDASEREEQQ
jgi:hypothetical protein